MCTYISTILINSVILLICASSSSNALFSSSSSCFKCTSWSWALRNLHIAHMYVQYMKIWTDINLICCHIVYAVKFCVCYKWNKPQLHNFRISNWDLKLASFSCKWQCYSSEQKLNKKFLVKKLNAKMVSGWLLLLKSFCILTLIIYRNTARSCLIPAWLYVLLESIHNFRSRYWTLQEVRKQEIWLLQVLTSAAKHITAW